MPMDMPYLLWITQRSPFARRVKLAMERLGVPYQERLTEPFAMEQEFLAINPLGLVPALSAGDLKEPLIDSTLILDFLHERSGGKIWGNDTAESLRVRRASMIAAGLMQVAVQRFLETHRASPDVGWFEDHVLTLVRGLIDLGNVLKLPAGATSAHFNQAHWDWAGLLEYLDLRWPDHGWRDRHSQSVQILEIALKDPLFSATRPKLPPTTT